MQGLQPLPQHWDGEGSWGLRASQSCSFPLIVCKTQALHQKQHDEEGHVLISRALFGGLRKSLSSILHVRLRDSENQKPASRSGACNAPFSLKCSPPLPYLVRERQTSQPPAQSCTADSSSTSGSASQPGSLQQQQAHPYSCSFCCGDFLQKSGLVTRSRNILKIRSLVCKNR